MNNDICIHAHFYQPPRENPWLESIEYQESAYPYHDWNEKITAECYQPNGVARILDDNGLIDRIVNNYSRISFNFGPTLLSWLAAEDPSTYQCIIDADRESRDRFSGHGSAIAQAYNHSILPLCNHRDKHTQTIWGIHDFRRRFGRKPEGMWLPETAVDLDTLDVLAQEGIKFTILAPHQARRVRKRGDRTWRNLNNRDIDPTRAYEIRLPTGRRMALFFYDGPISLAVGFQKLLNDGNAFANRLMGAASAERTWPQLLHLAVDGETFGHHHRFGEMALAFALDAIESSEEFRLTNYGEFLERNPPTHLVEIWENSAWSCPHETGRWKNNCGCNTGSHPDWNQTWRTPLREALDWLRDHLESLFDDDAVGYFKDPWAARNDYINIILDRSPESIDRFLAEHAARRLDRHERVRTLKLMELQRHAMLMYTSCGWFFDDLSGIETIQILQYAGRTIQLGEELFGRDSIESTFLELLQKAESNLPALGNGKDLYNKFVKTAMIDKTRAVGHYAVSSLFHDYPVRSELYSYHVNRKAVRTISSGRSKLVVGKCEIVSKITTETSELEYGVIHLGDHNVSGGVRESKGATSESAIVDGMTAAFNRADLPAVFRHIDEFFGQSVFSLKSLFRDEQRRVLDKILQTVNTDMETLNRQAFERTAPLMRFMKDLGLALPSYFINIATAVINARLLREFQSGEPLRDHIDALLKEADSWSIALDREGLEYAFRETLEKVAGRACTHSGNLPELKSFAWSVQMAEALPFTINLYRTQNYYYDILINQYPAAKIAATQGDSNAVDWIEEFRKIGKMLSIKVE
jgi:alpha-amylase/alpha-mannosidase (GH57 family)